MNVEWKEEFSQICQNMDILITNFTQYGVNQVISEGENYYYQILCLMGTMHQQQKSNLYESIKNMNISKSQMLSFIKMTQQRQKAQNNQLNNNYQKLRNQNMGLFKHYVAEKRSIMQKIILHFKSKWNGDPIHFNEFLPQFEDILEQCMQRSNFKFDFDTIMKVQNIKNRMNKKKGTFILEPQCVSNQDYQVNDMIIKELLNEFSFQNREINKVIINCSNINPYNLRFIFTVCKELRFLTLSHSQIQRQGLDIILKMIRTSSLKQLDLQDNLIDDKGMRKMSQHQFANLRSLNLRNNRVGNKGLYYLAKIQFPSLLQLNLCENENFTDDALRYLSKAAWPSLKILKFSPLQYLFNKKFSKVFTVITHSQQTYRNMIFNKQDQRQLNFEYLSSKGK